MVPTKVNNSLLFKDPSFNNVNLSVSTNGKTFLTEFEKVNNLTHKWVPTTN